MAVFRVQKTQNYTIMSNHHLRNKALSLKAKGLLSLMLSLPEDWDYTTRGLASICKEGVDSVCATVRELEAAGYIIRRRIRDRSIEQKLRQENGERERQKQAAEKKIKAAQYKQKRYEDEVIRCLDGQSRFSEEMLARLIAEAETEVRQAKEEYAELLRNDTTRATIQQIRSYYDEFLGWANEFDLATIPRKRAILGQLIEKVEVGKGYKVTVHLRMSYAQFLGIEGNGEIQVRKDVCA